MMELVLAALALIAGLPTASLAGNSDHSWQTAGDGISWGGRSADVRPAETNGPTGSGGGVVARLRAGWHDGVHDDLR